MQLEGTGSGILAMFTKSLASATESNRL